MLSSVLSSQRAVQMNIVIVRAFIKLREVLASHKDMAARLEDLETTQKQHGAAITIVIDEIKKLKTGAQSNPPKRQIGFRTGEK